MDRSDGELDLERYVGPPLEAAIEAAPLKSATAVRRLLRSIGDQLGMDVAYIAELSDDQVFHFLEGDGASFGFQIAGSVAAEKTYCRRMVDGDIPSLICDAVNDPLVKDMRATAKAGIGAYLGVPIVLPDGSTYGSLCVMSHTARPDLDERRVESLQLYAGLVGQYLGEVGAEVNTQAALRARVGGLIADRGIEIAFQPIMELVTRRTVGFEALSRFPPPDRNPQRWFDDAELAGMRAELEFASVRAALNKIDRIPPDTYLSLNFSPSVLNELPRVDLDGLAERLPFERIVLEVTEQAPVDDYARLGDAMADIRNRGARLAIDDVGAGFANMRHIIQLRPDIIKLDISLVRDIDSDPSRRALAASIAQFGTQTGAKVVAEGIETPTELDALVELGIPYGQGYLLGRPGPL
ncbi:MAG: EAL domain-containing protein [Chloroflexota bacterium]